LKQVTEGTSSEAERGLGRVGFIQINSGRREPGTGEGDCRNVSRYVHAKDFEGIISMEHGNSLAGRDGERAVIDPCGSADTW
jgi:hydroxypyruvate isomerase